MLTLTDFTSNILSIRRVQKRIQHYQKCCLHQANLSVRIPDKIGHQERELIVEDAFKIYDRITKNQQRFNSKLIQDMLDLCTIYNQPGKALNIWNEYVMKHIKGEYSDDMPYSLLLECLIESNNIKQCIELIAAHRHKIHSSELSTALLKRLVKECVEKSQLDIVYKWTSKSKDSEILNLICYRFIADFEDMKTALEMFGSLKNKSENIELIQILMRKCIQMNNYEQALYLFDCLKESTANSEIYCMAIDACTHLKNKEKFIQIELMLETHNQLKQCTRLSNALINYYGECVSLSSAKMIFNKVLEKNRNFDTYLNMLNIFIRGNEFRQALRFYQLNKNRIQTKLYMDQNHQTKTKNNLNRALFELYTKCNKLEIAKQMFEDEEDKDIEMFSLLMNAYFDDGKYKEVLSVYDEFMASDLPKDTDIAHEIAMNAHLRLGDELKANEIGSKHLSETVTKDLSIENKQLSNEKVPVLHGRIVNKIDEIMLTHLKRKQYEEALDAYANEEDKHKNYITHTMAIKAVTALKDLKRGKEIHSEIETKFPKLYESNTEIKTSLIHFYGKCSLNIKNALNIFESIHTLDIVAIGAMMNVYISHSDNGAALQLYDKIDSLKLKMKNVKKELATHKIALKACTNLAWLHKGRDIHSKLIINNKMRSLFDKNVPLKNTLINFYGACNEIDSAKKIFDSMNSQKRDIVTIGCMMNAYSKCEQYTNCLKLFSNTRNPDIICYITALHACILSKNESFSSHLIDKLYDMKANGKNTFIDDIRIQNLMGKMQTEQSGDEGTKSRASIGKHVLDMGKAFRIFQSVPNEKKNIILVNSMMDVYCKHREYKKALALYDKIGKELNGASKNEATFTLAIKCCTALRDYDKGKEIHSECIPSEGINSSLIKFYGKLKDLSNAKQIFDAMGEENKSVQIKTAMMGAYNDNDQHHEALNIFYQISKSSIDAQCYLMAFNSCIGLNDYEKGIEIYDDLKNNSRIKQNVQIKNALIRFYGQCSPQTEEIGNAEKIFYEMNDDEKDIFSFGSMMNVLIDHNDDEQALNLYEQIESNETSMKYENVSENNQVLSLLALKACSNMKNRSKGMEIHSKYGKKYSQNISFQTALIGFYSNCGDIKEAKKVFDAMDNKSKDYQTIGTMMSAFIEHGHYRDVVDLYDLILSDNKNQGRDNAVIYLMTIKACSHLNDREKLETIHRRFEKYEHLFDNKIQIQTALKQLQQRSVLSK